MERRTSDSRLEGLSAVGEAVSRIRPLQRVSQHGRLADRRPSKQKAQERCVRLYAEMVPEKQKGLIEGAEKAVGAAAGCDGGIQPGASGIRSMPKPIKELMRKVRELAAKKVIA